MKRVFIFGICLVALAALLATPGYAKRPIDCQNIATAAGAVPPELAAACAGRAPGRIPRMDPSDMAVSPDGVLTQCAAMTLNDPGNVSVVGSIPFRPACDFAGGDFTKLYCYTFDVPGIFSSVDPTTCDETVIGSGNNVSSSFNGLAWDEATGTMYGVTNTELHTVDLGSGASTMVGNLTGAAGLMIGNAIHGPTGAMYGFDIIDDSIYSIDKGSGAATFIGPAGFDGNFAQGFDCDDADGTCYLFAFNNAAFLPELRTVDLVTGNTTLIGAIGQTSPGGLQEWTGPGIMTTGDSCDGIELAGPSTADPGVDFDLDVSCANGGVLVGIAGGRREETSFRTIPGCGVVEWDIGPSANGFGSEIADGDGNATSTQNLGGQFGGNFIYYQALDVSKCETSNVVAVEVCDIEGGC